MRPAAAEVQAKTTLLHRQGRLTCGSGLAEDRQQHPHVTAVLACSSRRGVPAKHKRTGACPPVAPLQGKAAWWCPPGPAPAAPAGLVPEHLVHQHAPDQEHRAQRPNHVRGRQQAERRQQHRQHGLGGGEQRIAHAGSRRRGARACGPAPSPASCLRQWRRRAWRWGTRTRLRRCRVCMELGAFFQVAHIQAQQPVGRPLLLTGGGGACVGRQQGGARVEARAARGGQLRREPWLPRPSSPARPGPRNLQWQCP